MTSSVVLVVFAVVKVVALFFLLHLVVLVGVFMLFLRYKSTICLNSRFRTARYKKLCIPLGRTSILPLVSSIRYLVCASVSKNFTREQKRQFRPRGINNYLKLTISTTFNYFQNRESNQYLQSLQNPSSLHSLAVTLTIF